MPDFTLNDQDGKTVTARSLRGKPVVFAFVYSTCRDTCPAQVQTIRNALDRARRPGRARDRDLGRPGQRQPEARRLVPAQAADDRAGCSSCSARASSSSRSGRASPIQPQEDKLEHSAHTVLADARGFQRIGFPFDHLTSPALAHDLGRLLG